VIHDRTCLASARKPTHYYPLLFQGAPGEGDKETYGWAATALNEPIHYVKQPVEAIGHRNQNTGSFDGSAMVQYDPRYDYTLSEDKSTISMANPVFVHANIPKFNPKTIFQDPGLTQYSNGSFRRVWDEKAIDGINFDLERRLWEEIKWTGCQLEDKLSSWKDQGICTTVKEYWDVVFGEPKRQTER
jgi:alpha 1,2-mannosyltransferase